MATPSDELLRRWDAAAEHGVLRTSAASARWRVAPGDLRLLVTFNPLHRANKRPVAAELAVESAGGQRLPLGSTGFNFTKAKPLEFLCGLHASAAVPAELALEPWSSHDEDERARLPPHHAVLVNVSPLMRGHSLFVFEVEALHPQSLTWEMLRLAAGVGHLIAREDFALGFNSAGAWSSVNHCHFQGYWMDDVAQQTGHYQFPVVTQQRELCFDTTVGTTVVSVSYLPQWPARTFTIESAFADSCGSAEAVVKFTWTLIRLLQQEGIPHNLLLTWRPRLVAFVFPRQHQQENGVGRFSNSTQQLRFAVAELAGLVVTGSDAMFSEFSQGAYEEIMEHEVSLGKVAFSRIAESLRKCTLN